MRTGILKRVYIGTAATTVALACLAAMSGASETLKYVFLAGIIALQLDFYRHLSKASSERLGEPRGVKS